jgi:hypothetical protein
MIWVVTILLVVAVHGFSSTTTSKSEIVGWAQSKSSTILFEGGDDDSEGSGAWDENVDYDKEWPGGSNDKGGSGGNSLPDPGTSWDTLPNRLDSDFMGSDANELLGIDLSLEPLSAKDANRLRDDARKIVEEAIDAGVNDIEALKKKMKRELDASRQAMSLASDLEAKRQSELLMSKIDGLTGDFLKSTESSRTSTKMAAAASRAMEGTAATGMKANGLEVGTWGVLGGRTVVADDERANSRGGGLLGSVGNAVRETDLANSKSTVEYSDFNDFAGSTTQEETVVEVQENRILIVADLQKDKLAKQLVPALQAAFEKEEENIPNLSIDVLAPSTANMPLGGNDADCVIVFCAGLSQPDSLKKMLDRLLRKTIGTGGGKVGTPPTQLIGISTLGTERADAFPYSVQNFLGGKLQTRRQIEEVLINTVRNRVVEPPLDYTIIKMKEGEFVAGGESDFSLLPGDVLDDATSIETATQVILQAVAYQPPARNSTISLSGSLPSSVSLEHDPMSEEFEKQDDFWRETFACLDGPELWRTTVLESELADSGSGEISEIFDYYDRLIEYLREWGDLLALSGKGLTTPIRAETDSGLDPTSMITPSTSRTLLYQDGIRLLFLPTSTGKNYVSREEELRREQDGAKGANKQPRSRKIAKDGGIDVVVEIANTSGMEGSGVPSQELRVRARRTNYADDAVIKEISETTIVKRLEDAIEVFKTDQNLV